MENFGKMLNFAARCQAPVPEWMHKAFAAPRGRRERALLSVAIACAQFGALVAEGVEHLHLYTLNNPDLTFDVCRALGYVAPPRRGLTERPELGSAGSLVREGGSLAMGGAVM